MQEVEHNNMLQSEAKCVDCLQKICVHSLTVSTWVMSQIRVNVRNKNIVRRLNFLIMICLFIYLWNPK